MTLFNIRSTAGLSLQTPHPLTKKKVHSLVRQLPGSQSRHTGVMLPAPIIGVRDRRGSSMEQSDDTKTVVTDKGFTLWVIFSSCCGATQVVSSRDNLACQDFASAGLA